MNDVALSCKNLVKTFRDGKHTVEVLKGIDLEVHKGELVSLVGSSGSGKSSLLHLLGGLDKPTSGEVEIAGDSINKLSERAKSKLRNQSLGFVYQFHHLLPEFTAIENVCMPLLIRGSTSAEAIESARSVLAEVGLENRLRHKPSQLSGGERQRVAIARALVAKPLCILADEPTGNLDNKTADKVLKTMLDLQKNYQTSILIVTHDCSVAEKTNRILTLENGVISN